MSIISYSIYITAARSGEATKTAAAKKKSKKDKKRKKEKNRGCLKKK